MPTYDYEATACPPIQTPNANLYAGSDPPTPVVGTAVTAGPAAAVGLVDLLNADQVRGNLLGRYGGGAYAIWRGLELSAGSGLTLNISAGQAGADGPAEVLTDTTLALTDNVLNRVWLSRLGALSAVTSASASPLEPPDTATQWVFLGTVACGAAAISGIDYSGRLTQYQGNLLFRETADAGEPEDADDLPSTVRFFTRTQGGLYLWTGEEYAQVDGAADTVLTSLVSASASLDDLERRFRLQLLWTAQMLGLQYIHPDLVHEVSLAN